MASKAVANDYQSYKLTRKVMWGFVGFTVVVLLGLVLLAASKFLAVPDVAFKSMISFILKVLLGVIALGFSFIGLWVADFVHFSKPRLFAVCVGFIALLLLEFFVLFPVMIFFGIEP